MTQNLYIDIIIITLFIHALQRTTLFSGVYKTHVDLHWCETDIDNRPDGLIN